MHISFETLRGSRSKRYFNDVTNCTHVLYGTNSELGVRSNSAAVVLFPCDEPLHRFDLNIPCPSHVCRLPAYALVGVPRPPAVATNWLQWKVLMTSPASQRTISTSATLVMLVTSLAQASPQHSTSASFACIRICNTQRPASDRPRPVELAQSTASPATSDQPRRSGAETHENKEIKETKERFGGAFLTSLHGDLDKKRTLARRRHWTTSPCCCSSCCSALLCRRA